MKCILGIDVGGTNIKIGKFNDGKIVERYFIRTTNDDKEMTLINQICTEIKNFLGDDELIGLGIGIPGPVVDGVVLGAQNIKWEKVELKKILEGRFPDIPIAILNDANAATLGEWYFGSGEKKPNTVLITLGTGIGGGIIINNNLIEGETGSCGELGHIKIFPFAGRQCTCGLEGCLEQYASATGIVKTARGMINNGPSSLRNKQKINAKDVFDAAKEGDTIALDIVDKTSYYLAIGLANIANTLNPNIIIIGGGVSKAGDFFLDRIKKYFQTLAFYSVRETKIVMATLYNDAGIYGCFAKVNEILNTK